MSRFVRVASLLTSCLLVTVLSAQEPAAKKAEPRPQPVIDFRWLESKQIEGVTQVRGWFKAGCGPDEYMFPHKTPVLTAKDVARAEMCKVDFSSCGLPGEMYMVTFHFTDEAKKKLAAECRDGETRPIAAYVDGRTASQRYIDKSHAADFVAQYGFISSRTEAERIVAAFK
jgi:hypothetical protein